MQRFLVVAVLAGLTACASSGVAPSPAPPPPAEPPARSDGAVLEGGPRAEAGNEAAVAAPGVSVAPDRPAPPSGELTVPGARPRPVAPPRGDPRTVDQRMADIRRWDTCVMRLQGDVEGSPTRPILESPEEVCSRTLGMRDRLSVPDARR